MDKVFIVYILASGIGGYLYMGVTTNLPKRLWEHRNGYFKNAYAKKHGITQLVFLQVCGDAESAFTLEKKLKKMPRHKKFSLIEEHNRDWHDLSGKFMTN